MQLCQIHFLKWLKKNVHSKPCELDWLTWTRILIINFLTTNNIHTFFFYIKFIQSCEIVIFFNKIWEFLSKMIFFFEREIFSTEKEISPSKMCFFFQRKCIFFQNKFFFREIIFLTEKLTFSWKVSFPLKINFQQKKYFLVKKWHFHWNLFYSHQSVEKKTQFKWNSIIFETTARHFWRKTNEWLMTVSIWIYPNTSGLMMFGAYFLIKNLLWLN